VADLGSLLGSAGVGGAIGKAVVQLELDTAKYQAEMKAAQAQTTAGANSMGSGLSQFGGIAKTAFLGAGVAAVAFGAFAVKAAIEANDAHLKLSNTFENNKRLSDSSVEAFERQADSLRDLTGVDDEAITSGMALLGSFKLTGQQVQELTPLVVDLASKYDIDLQAAFKAVGKATQGSAGVLSRYGIVLDESKLKADAFGTTLQGLGVAEGFAADRAEAEPWRVLGAQFEEIAERIGQDLLPVLTEFAEGAIKIVEAMGPLLDLLGRLSPVVGLLAEAFSKLISPLATVIDLLGDFEPTQEMVNLMGSAVIALESMKQKAALAAAAQGELAEKTDEVTESMREQLDAMLALADSTFGLITATRDNRTAENELAAAHRRVNELEREGKEGTAKYAEAKRDLREKSLAAAESQLDLANAARRLQQEIADGKTSRADAIEAIRDLGKEAGLTGKDIQGLVGDIKGGLRDAQETANRLAPGIGKSISEGIAGGITAGSSSIAVAASQAVQKAIVAARAAADAKSPSKKMHELGIDMMIGLANGISDAEQKAIDAARKALEKVIEQTSSALDKIQGKASSFRDTIRGAFSGFLDIGGAFGSAEEGTPLSAILANQVTGASHLADVLEALRRQGASKATLGQVASAGAGLGEALLQGGPSLIDEMNASLKTISEFANQTGKGLSEHFFGEKIDKVEKKLDQLHEDLRELNRLEREGHSHDIVLDGEKVSETTRKHLIRTGSRNPDIFGGRA